jgi:hypothetical protein
MAHLVKQCLVFGLAHLWHVWETGAVRAAKLLTWLWRGFPAA